MPKQLYVVAMQVGERGWQLQNTACSDVTVAYDDAKRLTAEGTPAIVVRLEAVEESPKGLLMNNSNTVGPVTHRYTEEYVTGLEQQLADAKNDLEGAWVLIANSYGGDWTQAVTEWRQAAELWRDRVLPQLALKTNADTPCCSTEAPK